ncbi:related to nuclear transcription factor Y subunit C-4 [Ramularia collo-cygni]|uniref:Related to nuclear transcription factor Y subunit C-4 n=1 Tax=Ramularia collo-cygni TaxID=112498 RepID=A0A2D3UWZ3_9PEZI|nr:related to nuclear transcription factor Y subunit C-4 [Ramularia collo-cygni]CZT21331.1 related to nuclear transcription factor Y subunit C-4 [Ramularia collo-cygni]
MQAPPYGMQPQQPPPVAAPKRYDGKNGTPMYDQNHGGHYGASAGIAASGHAPPPETFTGHWQNVSQGLNGQYRDILNTYWQNQVTKLETEEHDYKLHQLPLARIKKVMKADPEVKMISAEAPILFAKGCDIFITELTMRAWIHAEENKRRTLQRSDIASALAKSDMFDFLIDIVPREDATPQHKRRPEFAAQGTYALPETAQSGHGGAGMPPEQAQMGGPQDFGGADQQHMPQQQYQQQMGSYPPPQPPQQYGGQNMFDPNIYGSQPPGYSMGQMQGMSQQAMYQPSQPPQHAQMTQPYRSEQQSGVDDQDADNEQDFGANG